MKYLLLGLSLILGSVSLGRDFTKQTDGKIVEYTVVDGRATFKQVGNMHAGSMYWGLHDIACEPIDPKEKHRTFSGRVADYNIGTPRKGIPIFFTLDDKAPQMVAITDDAGKFSFRIYQLKNPTNNPGYILPKEYEEARLYVGFLGAFNNPQPETPSMGKPLPVGGADVAVFCHRTPQIKSNKSWRTNRHELSNLTPILLQPRRWAHI